MPFVKAGPNEYLLVGRGGRLENRGSAVQAFLMPGAVHVLVPSTKQEATFEFTQETRDGIPLRFKGIVIYRVTDPIAAAALFDFEEMAGGVERITTLLAHVCLGELRHAVSHMTMVECIEQRKTTLSGVVEAALRETVHHGEAGATDWGITVEVAQVSQVFIVDAGLRGQLEAEVRNEIKLKSDRSNLNAQEQARLAEMVSEGRVQDQRLASDREGLRREEELELARVARQRRMDAERVASEQQAIRLEQERSHAELDAERDRAESEAPVRLLALAHRTEVLRAELEMRRLQNEVKALVVEREMLLPRAEQELRREILPVEQAPRIVEAASKVLSGTNLSVFGDDAGLLRQVAPLVSIVARAAEQATQAGHAAHVPDEQG